MGHLSYSISAERSPDAASIARVQAMLILSTDAADLAMVRGCRRAGTENCLRRRAPSAAPNIAETAHTYTQTARRDRPPPRLRAGEICLVAARALRQRGAEKRSGLTSPRPAPSGRPPATNSIAPGRLFLEQILANQSSHDADKETLPLGAFGIETLNIRLCAGFGRKHWLARPTAHDTSRARRSCDAVARTRDLAGLARGLTAAPIDRGLGDHRQRLGR